MAAKSSFLDKVLGRIARLDTQGLQVVVERLARERTFLETLFNTIEDGVLVVDENGRILYYNQAVTKLLGLQANVEGQHVSTLIPELDWERVRAFDMSGSEGVVRHEFEVQFPRPRFLRLYAAPLDGHTTGSTGVALILHDATEARQQTYQAIESERVQALTLLAASVAHEIGNPLNALHIHLQLMDRELRKLKASSARVPIRDLSHASESTFAARPTSRGRTRSLAPPRVDQDSLDSTQKLEQYLAVAKGEINRLDYIVTQFLQAIRPTPPQIQLAQVNEVVARTLNLLGPELENRGFHVRSKLARDLPLAPIDPTQIQQVLLNLIKNAMQAMTKAGTLTLQTGEGADGIWVNVSDTGGGIPQDQINRIFEPFYTTKKKGSGLGLMIVQRILRAHGGRIDLESKVGQGTTFRIWLPLNERKPRLLEAPLPG